MPKISKVISLSIPPEMAEHLQQAVTEDGRTVSEGHPSPPRGEGMVETRAPPTGRGAPERTGMSKEVSMNKKRLQSLTPGALYARVELGEFGFNHRI